ncbi:hypothetical protein ACH4GK_00600 [Streptomyces rimosus]|uniref:hypothetical protein n=1 Tax=Streptomyces rimosus TaxID=1927 RepID=UPI0004CB81A0|nr:hypothetical protein [Streptomyces rimosus]
MAGPADQPGQYGGAGKRLIADAQLRAELELCDRYRIPHSFFLGVGDGRWSETDRAKALAFDDPDAHHDLNRLYAECRWDVAAQRMVIPG